ncbi:MAG: hypothetical protein HQL37_14425 [Alphaproteobacteria bacterium]|nr:hypothetical protein [Alphaproteobacteria bacterium]
MEETDILAAELKAALAQYRADPQLGANAALGSVLMFLKQRGVDPGLLEPILAVQIMFADLSRGARNAMAERAKLDHRPPDSYITGSLKGQAAAAMHLMIQAGMGKMDAATYVAQAVRKWPWGAAKTVNKKTVAGWRDAAMTGLDVADMDRTLYLGIVQSPLVAEWGAKVVADQILDNPRWPTRLQDQKSE